MKGFFKTLGVAFLGGVVALGGYKYFIEKPQTDNQINSTQSSLNLVKANYTPAITNNSSLLSESDFTDAAEKTVHAVVHVKNTAIRTVQDPYDFFFGGIGKRKQQQVGTGSGVIISSDGYIVTNNHVIEDANEIEITLNNRKKYKAKLVGNDTANDIALLKINTETELPYIPFGDSDNAKIGEWVLAVGNPYNLTSTVTAGIISAKGRDLKGNANIDAFIQTDAAVNPGNSGGALVNIRGELIGINTAISSRTGSFIGYSFAVPSNIAKKVIDDILEFGAVQEALFGISYAPSNNEISGVKIVGIEEGGGAEKAGLKKGDVVKKINNVKISKFSELRGQLSAKRPGDNVMVLIDRNGKEIQKTVTLGKKNYIEIKEIGLFLKDVSASDKKKHNIESGAKVVKNSNRLLHYYGVAKGYIITKVNKEIVKDAKDAKEKLITASRSNKPMFLETINLKGARERYAFNK